MAALPSLKILLRCALVAASAATLAACEEMGSSPGAYRAYAPISSETLALMESKGTAKASPILIRAYKKEAELEVWKAKADGRYVLLKTYPMCRWSGQLGPKVREGDRQVPEGFYTITPGSMMPNSAYYLSFGIGFPNAYDRAWGHSGNSIMVHGVCSSAGCFSMTDEQVQEIYATVREAFAGGQRSIQMQSLPFRMTAENLAKHRLDPNIAFWRELKHGADHFDVTRRDVPVGVCDRRYVFAAPKAGARLDAEASCPQLDEDGETERSVIAKDNRDLAEIAVLVAKGVKPIRLVYLDGGQNPVFSNRFPDVSRPDALAAKPQEIPVEGKAPASVAGATATVVVPQTVALGTDVSRQDRSRARKQRSSSRRGGARGGA